jgi:hypothetical protein
MFDNVMKRSRLTKRDPGAPDLTATVPTPIFLCAWAFHSAENHVWQATKVTLYAQINTMIVAIISDRRAQKQSVASASRPGVRMIEDVVWKRNGNRMSPTAERELLHFS